MAASHQLLKTFDFFNYSLTVAFGRREKTTPEIEAAVAEIKADLARAKAQIKPFDRARHTKAFNETTRQILQSIKDAEAAAHDQIPVRPDRARMEQRPKR